MRLLVFCEAPSDFRTITGLVDRVLREEGPDWVREHLEFRPFDDLRQWINDGNERAFFDVDHIYQYAEKRGLRLPHGGFNGRRAGAYYIAALTAFLVARYEAKQSESLDAVIFVVDADAQGDERREGMKQARDIALRDDLFRIVIGCADMEREAWVLAGFDSENATERASLDKERIELGFCPCKETHRLRDPSDSGKRSLKRVLAALVLRDFDRESRCWTEAPLDRLRAHGQENGLAAFLNEVTRELVPLFEARLPLSPRG